MLVASLSRTQFSFGKGGAGCSDLRYPVSVGTALADVVDCFACLGVGSSSKTELELCWWLSGKFKGLLTTVSFNAGTVVAVGSIRGVTGF